MEGFKSLRAIHSRHKDLTLAVLMRAIKQGHFPGARRHGQTDRYLSDDEVAAYIKFRKLPRGEQIRLFYRDDGLMIAEEVSQLIDIGVNYIGKYRKRGLLPAPRFDSFSKKQAYHIDDVMEFVEKNSMLYDRITAKKFGWSRNEKCDKNNKTDQPTVLQTLQ